MPFQPAIGVYGAHVRGTILGQDVENTFYYGYTGSPDAGDAQDIADAIGAVVAALWIGALPTAFDFREVYVRDLANEFAVQGVDTSISGLSGTDTGAPLPSYNTVAIARRSAFTGRSARGRIFWMALGETMVTGNAVGSVFTDGMIDALIEQDAAVSLLGFPPLILSRRQMGVMLPEAVTFPLLTWAVNDQLVDTRRSRKAVG